LKSNLNVVGTTCSYGIDAQDRISHVSSGWNAFAIENGAPRRCLTPDVLGTSLWVHIHDWETAHIYQAVIAKVRKSAESITVPIRCDSPELKRFIEIQVVPLENSAVEFVSRIVFLEPRTAMAVLDQSQPRTDDLIRICSFCKQIDLGGDQWVDAEIAVIKMDLFGKPALPGLTHTICPACMEDRYPDDD
jgi:hypothetical protein